MIIRLIKVIELEISLLLNVGIVNLPYGKQVYELNVQASFPHLHFFLLIAPICALACEIIAIKVEAASSSYCISMYTKLNLLSMDFYFLVSQILPVHSRWILANQIIILLAK